MNRVANDVRRILSAASVKRKAYLNLLAVFIFPKTQTAFYYDVNYREGKGLWNERVVRSWSSFPSINVFHLLVVSYTSANSFKWKTLFPIAMLPFNNAMHLNLIFIPLLQISINYYASWKLLDFNKYLTDFVYFSIVLGVADRERSADNVLLRR